MARSGDGGAIGATVQQLRESAAFFRSAGGDAYRISATPATTGATLFARYDFAPDWTFAGQYALATTPSFENTGDSLITKVSTTRVSAYAVSLSRANLAHRTDRIAMTFTQPLCAMSGVMTFDLPTDIDASGQLTRTARAISLNPAGRERLTELSYSRSIGKTSMLALSALHRADPNHDALAPAERAVSIRISSNY
ncbi:MAG: hypothetical protein EXR39_06545 [Betaproteobacteria bacterium]|nr:hypothetical protein [Betaproteobacteria bacterium]